MTNKFHKIADKESKLSQMSLSSWAKVKDARITIKPDILSLSQSYPILDIFIFHRYRIRKHLQARDWFRISLPQGSGILSYFRPKFSKKSKKIWKIFSPHWTTISLSVQNKIFSNTSLSTVASRWKPESHRSFSPRRYMYNFWNCSSPRETMDTYCLVDMCLKWTRILTVQNLIVEPMDT